MMHPVQDELTLSEVAEVLIEIQHESQQDALPLYEFAGLLRRMIDIRLADNDESSTRLESFIREGILTLRQTLETGSHDFQPLAELTRRANETWGDELDTGLEYDDDANDNGWDAAQSEFEHEEFTSSDTPETDAPAAPSSAEISAILSQLSQPPAPAIQQTVSSDACEASQSLDSEDCFRARPIEGEQVSPSTDATSLANMLAGIESLVPELREAFQADANDCLGSMETALLNIESNHSVRESSHQILRDLHTLKGASASIGLAALADHLHELEEALRHDELAGNPPNTDTLLASVDSIRKQLADATGQTGFADKNATSDGISHDATGEAPESQRVRTPASNAFIDESSDDEMVRVKGSQLNRLMDMLAELVTLRNQRESEVAALQNVYHELMTCVSKMRVLRNEADIDHRESTSLQLSEVANDVLESAQNLKSHVRPFAVANTSVSRFIGQFRQELVQLRRTPISGLFKRLQRVARDAARAEGKQVKLELQGQEAGIERRLQQTLYEPLLHIVRNSVCHGIEDSDARQKAGKPASGTISLSAKSGPDLFAIEIRDDGKGLDYEAIRRRGIERGLLSSDQAPSREELAQLIFQPGFSTRDTASQVAGRGVGMDVVASTLEKARGWLEVKSETGQGTTIRLSFPLPSVIQHAMVFRYANQSFAIPMESVRSVGDVNPNIPRAPFFGLQGLSSPTTEMTQAIVLNNDQHGHGNPVAIYVEEIVGPEELVVRPLPRLLRDHPFCMGVTLSGSGQAVLLLDARRVLKRHIHATPATNLQQRPQPIHQIQRPPRVLVVDDSLSARKRVVRSLTRFPLDIVEATNGKEAMALVQTETFAAIFSDMEMPHLDGFGLLERIGKSAPDSPPIVIISSRSEDEFVVRARELGAADYLIKPLDDSHLDNTLKRLTPLQHLVGDFQPQQGRD